MIETFEKIIEGSVVSVTTLPARKAIKMKAKLIRLFGPVVAQLFLSEKNEKETDKEKVQINIVKAIETLSSTIDENSFENIITELVTGIRIDGMEINQSSMDLVFAGNMAYLYQVVWFVIEVNFSNFFSLLGIGNLFQSDPLIQTKDTKKTYIRK